MYCIFDVSSSKMQEMKPAGPAAWDTTPFGVLQSNKHE